MKTKLFVILILMFCYCCASCTIEQEISKVGNPQENKIVMVKVPPQPIAGEESDEAFYWDSQKFFFPHIKIPNSLPKRMPKDDGILTICLEKNGRINIVSGGVTSIYGSKISEKESTSTDILRTNLTVENVESLKSYLTNLFSLREENKIFEPDSEKVLKAVVFRASRSSKYDEVFRLVEAIESSGAKPIVLPIDDLPE